jgi:nucleotide-binding universal stress UspA family protein
MKVLVPLDGSRLADGVVAHVRRLARAEPVEATLLHVSPEYLSTAEEAARRGPVEDHLAAVQRLLAGEGLVVRAEVVVARDEAERIVDTARAQGYDLIALATHGRTGLDRWVRGSVAEKVLRAATVPVYVVNPRGLVVADDGVGAWRRILVPLDGSDRAASVLGLAGRFALAGGAEAELVLVHVDEPDVPGVHPVGEVATRQAQARAEAVLASYRERLERSGLRVRVAGRFGRDPAHELLSAAREHGADLIAMASHGRTGLRRWRFGSVAERVLREATTPLLVVRADDEG